MIRCISYRLPGQRRLITRVARGRQWHPSKHRAAHVDGFPSSFFLTSRRYAEIEQSTGRSASYSVPFAFLIRSLIP